MAQADGDGDGRSRRQWIIGRIGQIRAEFDDRAQELGGLLEELERLDRPAKEGRNRLLPPGWDIITGSGAAAALVAGARWARQHRRRVAAAAGTVGAAAAIGAVALLGRGTAVPHSHGGVPPTMTLSASASLTAPGPSSTARQKTPRPSGVPLPIIAPTRTRRTSPSASGAPSGPAGPSPTPPRPGPSPSPSAVLPPPFSCPSGLQLEIIGIGVFICI